MSKVLFVKILCTDTRPETLSIIHIGCRVVDSNGKEIDTLSLNAYVPDEACFDVQGVEYWAKHLRLLLDLKCSGTLNEARQKMIDGYKKFIDKHYDATIQTDTDSMVDISLLNKLF